MIIVCVCVHVLSVYTCELALFKDIKQKFTSVKTHHYFSYGILYNIYIYTYGKKNMV